MSNMTIIILPGKNIPEGESRDLSTITFTFEKVGFWEILESIKKKNNKKNKVTWTVGNSICVGVLCKNPNTML